MPDAICLGDFAPYNVDLNGAQIGYMIDQAQTANETSAANIELFFKKLADSTAYPERSAVMVLVTAVRRRSR